MSPALVSHQESHLPAHAATSPASSAQQELQRSPHGEHRSIRVQERNGVIRLEGIVTSFYVKQLAQILVIRRNLTSRIENAIEVA